MLAKIVKNQVAAAAAGGAGFVPFSVPEISAAKQNAEGVGAFVFPGITEIEPADRVFIETSFAAAQDVETDLQNARDEAASIIARAENDRRMIEEAALEKGLNEARARAEVEIAERVGVQLNPLRERLAETVEKISALSGEIIAQTENDVVELALEIAKKIVGREVSLDREIACTLVKISLGKLHNRSVAEVRLHPEDFEFVQSRREKLGFRGSLELVEDRSISPGGCLVHTETGDIDARIESQFDEIADGLLGK